jgi:hypothetical protein
LLDILIQIHGVNLTLGAHTHTSAPALLSAGLIIGGSIARSLDPN